MFTVDENLSWVWMEADLKEWLSNHWMKIHFPNGCILYYMDEVWHGNLYVRTLKVNSPPLFYVIHSIQLSTWTKSSSVGWTPKNLVHGCHPHFLYILGDHCEPRGLSGVTAHNHFGVHLSFFLSFFFETEGRHVNAMFLSSREEISQPGIKPPTSSLTLKGHMLSWYHTQNLF